ncbi:galectin-1-like [Aquarana catesbeiana]|uniref:galectin-1-like n=1 Tax=Aquarana catesbeiana TaxID=8400 RepID=UPI003CC99479
MADKAIRPGFHVDVEGFIPHGCKRFTINLGKDNGRNLVIHFDARFDSGGDRGKIVLNSMIGGTWGNEQKEGYFPFQTGSSTKVSFTFEQDKITVRLPSGSPFSFPIRFPISQITYVSVDELESKSITLQ